MKGNFYDIESLQNVFTLCNYNYSDTKENAILEIYYLLDNKELDPNIDSTDIYIDENNNEHKLTSKFKIQHLINKIKSKNKNLKTNDIRLYDLNNSENKKLIMAKFGCTDSDDICKKYLKNSFQLKEDEIDRFRLVCDTDPEYDPEIHLPFFGYNSYNYDTTMLAYYFSNINPNNNKGITAKELREYNNDLFSEQFKSNMPSRLGYDKKTNRQLYNTTEKSIRNNMLRTGRHIDIAKLNEKMQKVALKRLLAMLGFQILESDKLGQNNNIINNYNEFTELIAYNVSDVVNLEELSNHKVYKNQFALKTQMLKTYPELIYEQSSELKPLSKIIDNNELKMNLQFRKDMLFPLLSEEDQNQYQNMAIENIPESIMNNACIAYFDNLQAINNSSKYIAEQKVKYCKYEPDISPNSVKYNRLTPDSSSQQLASNSLCPYGFLKDIPSISYEYPHPLMISEEDKAKGIKPRNILEDAKSMFFEYISDENARNQFMQIYNFYKKLEGKNINQSDRYQEEYGELKIPEVGGLDKPYNIHTYIQYFDKNGKATECYSNFSTGGIHGAEYNKKLLDYDIQTWINDKITREYLKETIDIESFRKKTINQIPKHISLYNNQEIPDTYKLVNNKYLISDETITIRTSQYIERNKETKKYQVKENKKDMPKAFTFNNKNLCELDKKYVFTSSAPVNHEDFTSYYPNLLRMMRAFFNYSLGFDRYGEIFNQKELYGKLMKDKSVPQTERDQYAILREGVKLILNSASGAGDATFNNNIRMNNAITSMRIIGQLFTWSVAQYQTFHGAKVISTNTDGIYTIMERQINNKTLEEKSKSIGVAIEPEPMYLISKDSNNRAEFEVDDNDNITSILNASGGSLGCTDGPDPRKALSHPAIMDYCLTHYMMQIAKDNKRNFYEPFDEILARQILKQAEKEFDINKLLIMYQNVLASSTGSQRFIFAITPEDKQANRNIEINGIIKEHMYTNPQLLQHYNRSFIVKPFTQNSVHLLIATSKKITPATIDKRAKGNEPAVQHHPIAESILNQAGITDSNRKEGSESAITKINGVDEDWFNYIENSNIFELNLNYKREIYNSLEIDNYIQLIKESYENNWRNKSVESIIKQQEYEMQQLIQKEEDKLREKAEKQALKEKKKSLELKIKTEIKEYIKNEKLKIKERKSEIKAILKTLDKVSNEYKISESELSELDDKLSKLKLTNIWNQRKHELDDIIPQVKTKIKKQKLENSKIDIQTKDLLKNSGIQLKEDLEKNIDQKKTEKETMFEQKLEININKTEIKKTTMQDVSTKKLKSPFGKQFGSKSDSKSTLN